MALVLRFINLLKNSIKRSEAPPSVSINSSTVIISDEEIKQGENYYFRKSTKEVKKFLKVKDYENISKEQDNILYYTGRILPTEKVIVVGCMTDIMKDLASTSFSVPIIYKHSPIAYSIMSEIHWHSNAAKHSGI